VSVAFSKPGLNLGQQCTGLCTTLEFDRRIRRIAQSDQWKRLVTEFYQAEDENKTEDTFVDRLGQEWIEGRCEIKKRSVEMQ